MAKEAMIELEIPQGRKSFPVEQADGILRMRFNGGWKLPEDSEWTWSAERGFVKKGKKGQAKVEVQPKTAVPEEAASDAAATDEEKAE